MAPEKRPEPVRARALAVALAAMILHALVVRGFIPALDADSEQAIAAGMVDVAGALVTWWLARPHVTPTRDPRTTEQVPLVPAGRDGQPAPITVSLEAKQALRQELVREVIAQLTHAARLHERRAGRL